MLRKGFIGGAVSTTIAGIYSKSFATCTGVTGSNSIVRPRPSVTPMNLKGKNVLITGATAGIGLACAWRFAELGSNLILIGRRGERLAKLEGELKKEFPNIKIHSVAMSVTDLEKVAKLPTDLPSEFQNVDILVNNAGLALGVTTVDKNSVSDAATVLETNVLGTIAFCSAFIPGMLARSSGHIINIGSCAGHFAYGLGSVYNASKFAINGFTSAARFDVAGTPLRVTHLSPGLVAGTEFSNVRFGDDAKATSMYDNIAALNPEDVADNVIYAATRPPHVQIAEIIMYCTNQAAPRDIHRVGPSLGAK